MPNKLSVIIPFCNEYPAVVFTVQSVLNEIKALNAEVVVINNFCEEVSKQLDREEFCPNCLQNFNKFREEDKGGSFLKECSKNIHNLKYVIYNKSLSHWNAKNEGVKHSTGDILLFLDAHVIPSKNSIIKMFDYYTSFYDKINGTLHLPLSYLLAKPGRELVYSLVTNPEKGFYHYSFSKHKNTKIPYEVAVMSTCGMIMSREIFDCLGGWPNLHIYGGGEHFINFTTAILGFKKWIMNTEPLWHYAEKRGYNYIYDSFVKNRMIATYLFAGEEAAYTFAKNCRGNIDILKKLCKEAIEENKSRKKFIESKQVISINDWLQDMKNRNLWDGSISSKQFVD